MERSSIPVEAGAGPGAPHGARREAAPLGALALLLFLLALGGCGASPRPPGGDVPAPRAAREPPAAEAPAAAPSPRPEPDGLFPLLGDPRAVKGGKLVMAHGGYPTHLGYYGPHRDDALAVFYTEALYVTLISLHPVTLEVVPELAERWEISADGSSVTFHIDPDARWSDGRPIVAADVVATMALARDPAVGEVAVRAALEEMFPEPPEVVGERQVRFRAAKPSWRLLLPFADLPIYPAHVLDPATYLEAWRLEPPVVSGPYRLGRHEIGGYLELVRREDFWGWGKRQFAGLYNFDVLQLRDLPMGPLALETFKKGEVDFHMVTSPRQWVEECDFEATLQGRVRKASLRHTMPQPHSQLAFNLSNPLFGDRRVRQALFHLVDRDRIIDQLYLGRVRPKDSYFAASIYENANPPRRYDPARALALLAEAGWSERGTDGVLTKDGRRFAFELLYIHASKEGVYTVIQETYRRHGIQMNLRKVAPAEWIKVLDDRAFEMVYSTWSTQLFPELRDLWHSSRARTKGSANVTGFQSAEVDRLIEAYEREPDIERRVALVKQVDAILAEEVPYMLDWYADTFDLLWWDRFGTPEGISYPTRDPRDVFWKLWWYDEERARRLDAR